MIAECDCKKIGVKAGLKQPIFTGFAFQMRNKQCFIDFKLGLERCSVAQQVIGTNNLLNISNSLKIFAL
ncbi:hypothetical protein DHW03_00115 [Pedobacter yonginense]|uniref:Uncharacterized protein n=1 Tax=Pedobacter yonginense TaxID=651869 RepID=A0A317ER38_9SPHI|nr:hypothetical protein DHW03_00115 [Pedobacter yonginense]